MERTKGLCTLARSAMQSWSQDRAQSDVIHGKYMQVHTLTQSNQMLSDCVRSDALGQIRLRGVYEIKMK